MSNSINIKKTGNNIIIPILADAEKPRIGIKGKGYIPLDSDGTGLGAYVKIGSLSYKIGKINALKFSSDSAFTLSVATPGWLAVPNPGYIQYSIDNGASWNTWNGSQLSGTATQPIYLRGKNNTVITGGSNYKWTFTGKYVTGNIETLLDYQTVANGQHPIMEASCYAYMFYGCTSLTTASSLPATTLAKDCYRNMFYGCTSLTTASSLPATTLAEGCYANMFQGCTSLVTLPKLPATTLVSTCYFSMFYNCTSLKISTTKTGAYKYEYRIPTSGTGTASGGPLSGMFSHTGGTFKGTPTINTTYYTDHEPV